MKNKPEVKLLGENGNIFNLLGIACSALEKENLKAEAKELRSKIFSCGSYDEALQLIMQYCDVV